MRMTCPLAKNQGLRRSSALLQKEAESLMYLDCFEFVHPLGFMDRTYVDLYYDFLTTNNDNEEASLNHHNEGPQNGVESPAQLKQQIMGNV